VAEFEQAILSDARVQPAAPLPQSLLAASYFSWRGWQRLRGQQSFVASPLPPKKQAALPNREYFTILMSLTVQKCLPYFFLRSRKFVYLFDVWQKSYANILDFVRQWGIEHAFISSRQSALRLAETGEECKFTWIPEGVTPEEYRFSPASSRQIDVLQIGRMYNLYHQRILAPLQKAGKVYYYERAPGQIIFPTRAAFIEGLARAKISLCFTSNITHPERAGDIETMTARYLQSMASKCLVVGSSPAEMVDLFGYNPVIQADLQNPAEQLLAILEDFDSYHELIEKNYHAVCAKHTWKQRWEAISEQLPLDK
jgi:glycosyltransferase involved in cell wall biosynthesis